MHSDPSLHWPFSLNSKALHLPTPTPIYLMETTDPIKEGFLGEGDFLEWLLFQVFDDGVWRRRWRRRKESAWPGRS